VDTRPRADVLFAGDVALRGQVSKPKADSPPCPRSFFRSGAVAVLVFLAAAAGAGIVSADLGEFAAHGDLGQLRLGGGLSARGGAAGGDGGADLRTGGGRGGLGLGTGDAGGLGE